MTNAAFLHVKNPKNQEELRTLAREDNFLKWVVATLPREERAAAKAKLAHTPLTLLQELYPDIWQYGPRGPIYVQQLRYIKNKLDTANKTTAYNAAGSGWVDDFEIGVNDIEKALTMPLRGRLGQYGIRYGYPPLIQNLRQGEDDLAYQIATHPLFDFIGSHAFGVTMRTFRSASLYFPILTKIADKETTPVAFALEAVCKGLGLPQ